MLQDIAATRSKLQELRDAGIGVSIDDFGTGYSSLSYLQRFPVTTLKIARDFVDVDCHDSDAWELASAIVALGRALRLSVIAEGVEQWSQLGRLRTLGCEFAQGFYFARPLDPAAIESLLAHGGVLNGDAGLDPALARASGASRRGRLTVRSGRSIGNPVPPRNDRDFCPIVPERAARHRASTDDGSHIGCRNVRSANSANPSKGGDAKPGIFREHRSQRPPGCQAPHIGPTKGGIDAAGGSSGWRRRPVRRALGPTVAGASTSSASSRIGATLTALLLVSAIAPVASLAVGLRPGGRRRIRCTARPQYTGATAWWDAGYTGKGVDVALIDTGVSPVGGPRRGRQDRLRPGPLVRVPVARPHEPRHERPRHVHGRHHRGQGQLADRAVLDAPASAFRGMAPDARIVSVKVGVADGGTDVSQVIAAIDWVVQHKNDGDLNIRVINLSYGTNSAQDSTVDPLAYAAERAWKAGIVVVVAGGNYGFQNHMNNAPALADPAIDRYVLAVGASDSAGTLSHARRQGPRVLAAGRSEGPREAST